MRWIYMNVFVLIVIVGLGLFSGCDDGQILTKTPSLPYRAITFDAKGVARFYAQADDVLLIYRTGDLTVWPDRTGATQPPYEPITLAPAAAAQRATRVAVPMPDTPQLASQLVGCSGQMRSSGPHSSRLYMPEVGDTHLFHYADNQDVKMQLRAIGAHCYIWAPYADPPLGTNEQVQFATTEFDRIYPMDVTLFGAPSEVDYDPRIHVLGINLGGYAGGIFSSDLVRMNGLDIITLDLSLLTPGPQSLGGVMAHELQHDIWWAAKGNSGLIVMNEGMAEFAYYSSSPNLSPNKYQNFLKYPPGLSLTLANSQFMYGGGFPFCTYLHDRFGAAAFKKLSGGSPLNGGDNLQQATGCTPEQLLVDFSVALLMTGNTSDPRYQISSFPIRGTMGSVTLPPLGMVPMDGSIAGQCRAWGFCYGRALTTGNYTATVASGKDFHAVLVPGGAKGW